jgi:hypothetical protein
MFPLWLFLFNFGWNFKFFLHTTQWLENWPTKPRKIGSNQKTKIPRSEIAQQYSKTLKPNLCLAAPMGPHIPKE